MTTEAIQTADLEAKKLRDQGEDSVWLDELTPRQIVAELDKYIIGQSDAKKAVAIVLRNRWRRRQLAPEVARGDRYDEKCDVFSFGVLLFELASGPERGLRDAFLGLGGMARQLIAKRVACISIRCTARWCAGMLTFRKT